MIEVGRHHHWAHIGGRCPETLGKGRALLAVYMICLSCYHRFQNWSDSLHHYSQIHIDIVCRTIPLKALGNQEAGVMQCGPRCEGKKPSALMFQSSPETSEPSSTHVNFIPPVGQQIPAVC
jgi:hypothetical protein